MQYAWPVWPCQLELVMLHRTVGTEFGNPDSSLIMPDFDLTGELSLKIELHMLRPITEKVHSGNGPVSLVGDTYKSGASSRQPKSLEKSTNKHARCAFDCFHAYIWRADFQNRLHPLLYVTHLQLRSQQKSQFSTKNLLQIENVDLIEI